MFSLFQTPPRQSEIWHRQKDNDTCIRLTIGRRGVTALFSGHKYFSSDPFLMVALAFLILSGSNMAIAGNKADQAFAIDQRAEAALAMPQGQAISNLQQLVITGEGSVISDPPGLDCGIDCSEDFIQDTPVTLTATPADGFIFDYWSGDCTGGSADCKLTMSAGREVAAHFIEDPDVWCLDTDLLIENITFAGSISYCHGSTSISTSGTVIVEAAAEVTFESPEIFLMPGFWVIKGGEFHALTPEKIDPACTVDSTCTFFELNIEVSDNYDGHIAPLTRHVYHFRSPARESIPAPFEDRYIRFGVVDFGAEVSLNLGLSKVKGRTQPGDGEASECFTGPGTELSLGMATDDRYTDCIMEFDTDYYFSIENLDSSINGGYRFSFGKGGAY